MPSPIVDAATSITEAHTVDRPAARRLTLPSAIAFVGAVVGFASLYLAAGAPTPLLVLYEQKWGFPPGVLTIAFAAYAVGLLAALLIVGSLSDYVGRRPVLIVSLLVELAAMVMFLCAPDINWVIAARLVQGIATGAATGAFTASIVELAPRRYAKLGAIISGIAPAGGLGLGALLTGVAVQFSAWVNGTVFITLAVIMALGTLLAAFSRETVTRRRGAVLSLIPRVSIPPRARREFAAAVPVHLAAWMLAGLFMGLAPTIIQDIFHIRSGFLDGATAFVEPAAAAVTGLVLGRLTARHTTLIGGIGVFAGTAVIVGGVALGVLPLLWIGGIIGGVGFGASFSGAIRLIAPLAEAHQRAGLFAAVYVVAYLAFGVPAIIAGQLVGLLGLVEMIVAYGVVILAASAAGLVAQSRIAGRSGAV